MFPGMHNASSFNSIVAPIRDHWAGKGLCYRFTQVSSLKSSWDLRIKPVVWWLAAFSNARVSGALTIARYLYRHIAQAPAKHLCNPDYNYVDAC